MTIMTIPLVPLVGTTGWALTGLVVMLVGGLAAGGYAFHRNRRIVKHGIELRARVVEVEVTRPDQEAAARLRNVRVVLCFDGAEDDPQTYRAWRLRAADADAFVPDTVWRVLALPDDPSEIRVGRPDGAGALLPFSAATAG